MLCYAESKSYLKRLAFSRGPTKEILLKCVFKLLNNPSASCSFKNFNFLFSHTAHLIKSLLYRFLSLQCLYQNFFLVTFWLKDQILNLICNLSVFAISSCFFFFFYYYQFLYFNPSNYCTNVYSYCRTHNFLRNID